MAAGSTRPRGRTSATSMSAERYFAPAFSPAGGRAGRLTVNGDETLVPPYQGLLIEAIAAGGSSLRDHRQAKCGARIFPRKTFALNGREGESLPPAPPQFARKVQGGRVSFM